jgi:hypothetical protein
VKTILTSAPKVVEVIFRPRGVVQLDWLLYIATVLFVVTVIILCLV